MEQIRVYELLETAVLRRGDRKGSWMSGALNTTGKSQPILLQFVWR